jgi:hypothetical protein
MRRLFGSVRARATLAATLVVAVALVAAGAAVLLSLRSNLIDQAGTQAERAARNVAADLSGGTPYTGLELDDDDEPVQVVDAHGRLVAATEHLEDISGTGVTEVRPQSPAGGTAGTAGTGDVDDSDDDGAGDAGAEDDRSALEPGEIADDVRLTAGSATIDGKSADYRFAAVEVEVPDKGTLTVYAGASLDPEQSAVDTARTVMLVGFPLLLGVVAAVTWLVTRRALRPVEGIRAEMAAITASEDLAAPAASRCRTPMTRWPVSPAPPTRPWPRWRPPWSASGASSPTPRTSCAVRSPPCAPSSKWPPRTPGCWTWTGRSRTPYGCNASPRTCCCWPGWTRGSGRRTGGSTSPWWSGSRRRAARR